MKKKGKMSIDKQTERFFSVCNSTSAYYTTNTKENYAMSSALSATTNCCLEWRKVRSPSAELERSYPLVEEEATRESDTRGKKFEEPKPKFSSTKLAKPESSSIERTKQGIYNFAGIGIDVEVESRYAYNTHLVYVKYDALPPVYAEGGSIIVESEQLEVLQPYRVILDNVRYVVVKDEKGEIAIRESPP